MSCWVPPPLSHFFLRIGSLISSVLMFFPFLPLLCPALPGRDHWRIHFLGSLAKMIPVILNQEVLAGGWKKRGRKKPEYLQPLSLIKQCLCEVASPATCCFRDCSFQRKALCSWPLLTFLSHSCVTFTPLLTFIPLFLFFLFLRFIETC